MTTQATNEPWIDLPRITRWTLFDVCAGTNQFVAVGDRGVLLSSPDGVTWSAQNSGTQKLLTGVAYARGRFVAVGDLGTVLTSPDGITWTPQVSGVRNFLYRVTGWEGGYAAVGDSGVILRSANGTAWTSQFLAPPFFVLNALRAPRSLVIVGEFGQIHELLLPGEK